MSRVLLNPYVGAGSVGTPGSADVRVGAGQSAAFSAVDFFATNPLYLLSASTPVHQAYRFVTTIPQGATILDARVVAYVDWASASPATTSDWLEVGFERADGPPMPANASDANARRTNTPPKIRWNLAGASLAKNAALTSPNLAANLQEVVNRAGFTGTLVAFASATPTPATSLHAYHSTTTASVSLWPRLTVSYVTGGTTPPPPPPPPPPGELAGVGSASTSGAYPPTGPVTTGGTVVSSASALIDAVNGGVGRILVRAGTYTIPATLRLSTPGMELFGYGSERPHLRFTGTGDGTNSYVMYITADDVHVKGFEITGGRNNASAPWDSHVIRTQQADGVVIEDLEIHDGATGSVMCYESDDWHVLDVISYDCGGAGDGTNRPDGIVATSTKDASRASRRAIIARCLVANADDDCFDFFVARDSKFLDCVAIGAGYNASGSRTGDGNGFKSGGQTYGYNNEVAGCLVVGCAATGVTVNSAAQPNTFRNVTAYDNSEGFIFDTGSGSHVVQSCLAHANSRYPASPPGGGSANSWNQGSPNPDFADVAGGDLSLAAGSPAIGAGVSGVNQGASVTALALFKKWANHPDVHR